LVRARSTIAAVASIALLAGACSSESVTTTTTSIPQLASTTSSTAAELTTTTSAADPTTTTASAAGAVGSREALLELMSPLIELTSSIYGVPTSEVPIPDISGPDPVDAALELLLFEVWLLQNSTLEEWAGVVAPEGSPAWRLYSSGFDVLGGRTATFVPSSEPYSISEIRLATDEEAALVPDEIVEAAGVASSVVLFTTTLAPHEIADPGEPALTEARPGWIGKSELGVLIPTDLGWRWFWQGEL
jgi:hypothetical protein